MNDYPPEIQQQAARWAIRLAEAPLDDEQELAFQHWLAQDPRHRHALEQAGMLWHGLGSLSAEQRQVLQPQPPATFLIRRVNRATQWKIAALLLLGFSIGTTWISDGILMLRSDYHAVHQVKHVTLPDGSEVDMDAGSAISLAYTPQERRVTLLQGSARFTVAPTTTGKNALFWLMRPQAPRRRWVRSLLCKTPHKQRLSAWWSTVFRSRQTGNHCSLMSSRRHAIPNKG